jgi:hypothetical protein
MAGGRLPGLVDEIGIRLQAGHEAVEGTLVHGLEIGRGRLAANLLVFRGGELALTAEGEDPQ